MDVQPMNDNSVNTVAYPNSTPADTFDSPQTNFPPLPHIPLPISTSTCTPQASCPSLTTDSIFLDSGPPRANRRKRKLTGEAAEEDEKSPEINTQKYRKL